MKRRAFPRCYRRVLWTMSALVGVVVAWTFHYGKVNDPLNDSSEGGPTKPSRMWEALEEKAIGGNSESLTRHRQLRSFPIMRSSPERMPPRIKQHITAVTGAPLESLELETTQRIHRSDGDVWIVNGRNVTCLVHGALACTTMADFSARGISLGTAKSSKNAGGPPRDFSLLGLAPSWVKEVQIIIGSKERQRRIPVRHGVYSMRSEVPSFVTGFCGGESQACRHP